jgi:hypothetical protein
MVSGLFILFYFMGCGWVGAKVSFLSSGSSRMSSGIYLRARR